MKERLREGEVRKERRGRSGEREVDIVRKEGRYTGMEGGRERERERERESEREREREREERERYHN